LILLKPQPGISTPAVARDRHHRRARPVRLDPRDHENVVALGTGHERLTRSVRAGGRLGRARVDAHQQERQRLGLRRPAALVEGAEHIGHALHVVADVLAEEVQGGCGGGE